MEDDKTEGRTRRSDGRQFHWRIKMDPEGRPQGREDDQREAVTVGGSLNPHKLYMNYPGLLKERGVLSELPCCRLIFLNHLTGFILLLTLDEHFLVFPSVKCLSSNRSQMEISA